MNNSNHLTANLSASLAKVVVTFLGAKGAALMGNIEPGEEHTNLRMFAAALDHSELGREASAWLKQQAQLTAEQRTQMEKKEPPPTRWKRLSAILTSSGPLALSVGTTFVVLMLLAIAVGTLWSAAHERAVVIEALAVPQSLAARGITGQVAASELLDHMRVMQTAGVINAKGKLVVEPPDTPVKVEISSTNITLNEVYVYLRNWIGSDTFVSGELIDLSTKPAKDATEAEAPLAAGQTAGPAQDLKAMAADKSAAGSYELVARVGDGFCTSTGGDFAALYDAVAECLLQHTDPVRYATYLIGRGAPSSSVSCVDADSRAPWRGGADVMASGDVCKAITILQQVAFEADGEDRATALATLGVVLRPSSRLLHCPVDEKSGQQLICKRPNLREAWTYEAKAVEAAPASVYALGNKLEMESDLGFASMAFNDNKRLVMLYEGKAASEINPLIAQRYRTAYEAGLDELLYDFGAGVAKRKWLLDHSPPNELARHQEDYDEALTNEHLPLDADVGAENPDKAVSNAEADTDNTGHDPGCWGDAGADHKDLTPVDIASVAGCLTADEQYSAALAALATAPSDCYDCVLQRDVTLFAEACGLHQEKCVGDPLSREQQRLLKQAEEASLAATRLAPNLPGGWFDFGKQKMAAGDTESAWDAFAKAHALAPRYADILEYWGVSLQDAGRNEDAIWKFAEASAYAPQWGQLYVKWGKALQDTGDRRQAAAKYRLAARLSLTAAERSDLAAYEKSLLPK